MFQLVQPVKTTIPGQVVRVLDVAQNLETAKLHADTYAEVERLAQIGDSAAQRNPAYTERVAFLKTAQDLGVIQGLLPDLVVSVARKLHPDPAAVDTQKAEFQLRSTRSPIVEQYYRDRKTVQDTQAAFTVLFEKAMRDYLGDEVEVRLNAYDELDSCHDIQIERIQKRVLNLGLFQIPWFDQRVPLAKLTLENIASPQIRRNTDVPFSRFDEGIVASSIFYDPIFLEIAGPLVKLYDATLKSRGVNPVSNRRATYI